MAYRAACFFADHQVYVSSWQYVMDYLPNHFRLALQTFRPAPRLNLLVNALQKRLGNNFLKYMAHGNLTLFACFSSALRLTSCSALNARKLAICARLLKCFPAPLPPRPAPSHHASNSASE